MYFFFLSEFVYTYVFISLKKIFVFLYRDLSIDYIIMFSARVTELWKINAVIPQTVKKNITLFILYI